MNEWTIKPPPGSTAGVAAAKFVGQKHREQLSDLRRQLDDVTAERDRLLAYTAEPPLRASYGPMSSGGLVCSARGCGAEVSYGQKHTTRCEWGKAVGPDYAAKVSTGVEQ